LLYHVALKVPPKSSVSLEIGDESTCLLNVVIQHGLVQGEYDPCPSGFVEKSRDVHSIRKRALKAREGADDGRAVGKSIFARKGKSGLLEIHLFMKSGESEKQIRHFL
jgi:hypothetical protein